MKRIIGVLAIVTFLYACQETEAVKKNNFTGNETTYALLSGSTYPITGTVTLKEKKDGSTFVHIELSGTEGEIKHPVHLHMGDISVDGANVIALLNPVYGKTGISETDLIKLSDESTISYQQLLQYNGCVKIHLSDIGPDKNIILAGGNIGIATTKETAGGRYKMQVCKSE